MTSQLRYIRRKFNESLSATFSSLGERVALRPYLYIALSITAAFVCSYPLSYEPVYASNAPSAYRVDVSQYQNIRPPSPSNLSKWWSLEPMLFVQRIHIATDAVAVTASILAASFSNSSGRFTTEDVCYRNNEGYCVVLTPNATVVANLSAAARRSLLFGDDWRPTGGGVAISLLLTEYSLPHIQAIRRVLSRRGKVTEGTTVELVMFARSGSWWQSAPLAVLYLLILLYFLTAFSQFDNVASRRGIAFAAVLTVLASFFMTLGLTLHAGVSLALRAHDLLPYLVILNGFENVVMIARSVTSTPQSWEVPRRISVGLSTASLGHHVAATAAVGSVGLLGHPVVSHFSTLALVQVATDLLLQLFFFTACLAVDLRRLELADLFEVHPNAGPRPPPSPARAVGTGIKSALISCWRPLALGFGLLLIVFLRLGLSDRRLPYSEAHLNWPDLLSSLGFPYLDRHLTILPPMLFHQHKKSAASSFLHLESLLVGGLVLLAASLVTSCVCGMWPQSSQPRPRHCLHPSLLEPPHPRRITSLAMSDKLMVSSSQDRLLLTPLDSVGGTVLTREPAARVWCLEVVGDYGVVAGLRDGRVQLFGVERAESLLSGVIAASGVVAVNTAAGDICAVTADGLLASLCPTTLAIISATSTRISAPSYVHFSTTHVALHDSTRVVLHTRRDTRLICMHAPSALLATPPLIHSVALFRSNLMVAHAGADRATHLSSWSTGQMQQVTQLLSVAVQLATTTCSDSEQSLTAVRFTSSSVLLVRDGRKEHIEIRPCHEISEMRFTTDRRLFLLSLDRLLEYSETGTLQLEVLSPCPLSRLLAISPSVDKVALASSRRVLLSALPHKGPSSLTDQ